MPKMRQHFEGEHICCQNGLAVVPSRNWHGWDILEVFPIRDNELGAADDPLSQQRFVVRMVQIQRSANFEAMGCT